MTYCIQCLLSAAILTLDILKMLLFFVPFGLCARHRIMLHLKKKKRLEMLLLFKCNVISTSTSRRFYELKKNQLAFQWKKKNCIV